MQKNLKQNTINTICCKDMHEDVVGPMLGVYVLLIVGLDLGLNLAISNFDCFFF